MHEKLISRLLLSLYCAAYPVAPALSFPPSLNVCTTSETSPLTSLLKRFRIIYRFYRFFVASHSLYNSCNFSTTRTKPTPDATKSIARSESKSAKMLNSKPVEPETRDHYFDLGLDDWATTTEIKKAFKRLALLYHPDTKAPGQTIDAIEFRRVSLPTGEAQRENTNGQ